MGGSGGAPVAPGPIIGAAVEEKALGVVLVAYELSWASSHIPPAYAGGLVLDFDLDGGGGRSG
jgi:hypothetical protein